MSPLLSFSFPSPFRDVFFSFFSGYANHIFCLPLSGTGGAKNFGMILVTIGWIGRLKDST
jgi:hypothetical protein